MNKKETAFHEAGHIVMAMLWGVWRVDKVSLAGKDNSGGGIEYACVTETGTQLFDAKLERMLGGPVARAILLGRKVVYRGRTGDSDFDSVVSEIQHGVRGSNAGDAWAVIREHEPIVQADLKRMWPVVEALAQELIDKKELSDHQIRSIVRTAVNKLPGAERSWAISRLRNTPPRA